MSVSVGRGVFRMRQRSQCHPNFLSDSVGRSRCRCKWRWWRKSQKTPNSCSNTGDIHSLWITSGVSLHCWYPVVFILTTFWSCSQRSNERWHWILLSCLCLILRLPPQSSLQRKEQVLSELTRKSSNVGHLFNKNSIDFIHRVESLSFFYCIWRRNKLTLLCFVPIFLVFCRQLFKVSYAKENPGDIFEVSLWIKQFQWLLRKSTFSG